jgi:hypothetical protein
MVGLSLLIFLLLYLLGKSKELPTQIETQPGIYDEELGLLMSPGELVDRLTILSIKGRRVEDQEKRLLIHQQFQRANKLLRIIEGSAGSPVQNEEKLQRYGELVQELYTFNSVQWNLEDRVRTENSWEAAQAARENNSTRVEVKNEINKLFGFPAEVKEYKG